MRDRALLVEDEDAKRGVDAQEGKKAALVVKRWSRQHVTDLVGWEERVNGGNQFQTRRCFL